VARLARKTQSSLVFLPDISRPNAHFPNHKCYTKWYTHGVPQSPIRASCTSDGRTAAVPYMYIYMRIHIHAHTYTCMCAQTNRYVFPEQEASPLQKPCTAPHHTSRTKENCAHIAAPTRKKEAQKWKREEGRDVKK
jgi:hypothetical protein